MKLTDVDVFLCPKCKGRIALKQTDQSEERSYGTEVVTGKLACTGCKTEFRIINSIPRFVDSDNYAGSFGYQWNLFAKTQVGGIQTVWSKERFDVTTKWPDELEGEVILEAGCGAGRFSGIALSTGAEVYSFDLSNAIDAAVSNIQTDDEKKRHHPFQSSIYEIALPHEMFDKVFCMGVLQHTPDVRKSYLSLIPFLKPGGEIVIDCYLSQPIKHIFNLKYLLRPFFKWWKPETLFSFWSRVISMAFDLKMILSKIPVIGGLVCKIVPIGRLSYEPEMKFTPAELKEIKTLSVFDMLSPMYDQPQKLTTFRSWMEEAGLEVLEITTGFNGINARGRKPAREDAKTAAEGRRAEVISVGGLQTN